MIFFMIETSCIDTFRCIMFHECLFILSNICMGIHRIHNINSSKKHYDKSQ